MNSEESKEKPSENKLSAPVIEEDFELENDLRIEPTHTKTYMLGELEKLEQQFTENLKNLSKERFIDMIEKEYQKFCTEARVVFEERMNQIFTYNDVDHQSEGVKAQINQELERITKARAFLQKNEAQNNPLLIFRVGMLLGQLAERKKSLAEKVMQSAPQFDIKLHFNAKSVTDMISVRPKNIIKEANSSIALECYTRFKILNDDYQWNIGSFSAIVLKAKRNVMIYGFDCYRHRECEAANARYWVYENGTEKQLTFPSEASLDRQEGHPNSDIMSRILFPNPIKMVEGMEVELRVQHIKVGVANEKAYAGKELLEDEKGVFEIKNAVRSPNGTDKSRGQIPTIYYRLID